MGGRGKGAAIEKFMTNLVESTNRQVHHCLKGNLQNKHTETLNLMDWKRWALNTQRCTELLAIFLQQSTTNRGNIHTGVLSLSYTQIKLPHRPLWAYQTPTWKNFKSLVLLASVTMHTGVATDKVQFTTDRATPVGLFIPSGAWVLLKMLWIWLILPKHKSTKTQHTQHTHTTQW